VVAFDRNHPARSHDLAGGGPTSSVVVIFDELSWKPHRPFQNARELWSNVLSFLMISLAVMLRRGIMCLRCIFMVRSRFLMRVLRHDYLLKYFRKFVEAIKF
jgi:hypothetical protein